MNRTFGVTSIAAAAALAAGAALAAPGVDRRDVARSYADFERAAADVQAAGGTVPPLLRRRYDRMAHLVMADRLGEAVAAFDDGYEQVAPPQQRSVGDRAARATRVIADPATLVRDDDGGVRLAVSPIYDVGDRPGELELRVRPADGDDESAPVFSARVQSAGDAVTWDDAGTAPAGRYLVTLAAPGDDDEHARAEVAVVDRRPSDVRAEVLAKLDEIEAVVPADDLRRARSIAAARSRAGLLADAPDPERSASFLADQAALSLQVPAEVALLAAGGDPYAGRAGDYWRTFDLTAAESPVPLRVPARVTAPAGLLEWAEADGAKLPLVIALHGAGGDENLFAYGYGAGLIERLAADRGFLLVTPLTYPALSDARTLPLIVDAMAELYPIDRDRVYALGHSLGAMTTSAWARNVPDTLAAAALLAGGGAAPAADRAVPTYIAAARYDRLFPLARLEQIAAATRSAGAEAELDYFADQGHVSVVPIALPSAVDFLLSHRKD